MTPKGKVYRFYVCKRKSQTKIKTYLVVFFVCIIIFAMILLVPNKLIKTENNSSKMYLLSLGHSTSFNMAETKQDEINEVFGVSYIYKISGVYHVLGFIYDNETDAKEMLSTAKKVFPDSLILLDSREKIKSKIYSEITKDKQVKNIFEYQCNIKDDVLDLCKYVKSESSDLDTYLSLTKLEIKLDECFELLGQVQDSSVIQILKTHCSVMLSLLRTCKDELSIGSDTLENLKLLYMKLYFVEGDLKNSLNKL